MKTNKENFLQVLEHHQRIIFKVCNSYCADHEDRKDLVQEVIVQLWKSFPKYDDRFKLSTWIYRIALNVAISHYRKEHVRQSKRTQWQEDFFSIADEDAHEMGEDIHLLRQFINKLDSMNRALMLLYLDDHSYDEIAGILDISVSNVGTKLNRLKQKLKQYFTSLEPTNYGTHRP
ncbi:RNA polymerase sigma factor [Porifericola rhodea]|uniref:RNA polymerase sigma factor n=1 Tax=Porifericola rhodea TaxID=930972 RepID=UPI00266521F1|nr:RNA polymerase sigma factor [Porifericola rhodea]WKN31309.1 RNA polymerase sigma factor [Porifericola rhodea]